MKLCLRCLDRRVLCSKCRKKLESGEITQLDVELERVLHKLSKKNPDVKKAEILKTFDAGSILIIVNRGNAKKLIGNQGQTIRDIAEAMKRHVRVMEEPRDMRDFLSKMINPSAILGVDVLYTPEGETFRVRVAKSFKNRIPINADSFPEVAKELVGKNMELSFE